MENLGILQSKILNNEELRRILAVWRFLSKKIVFTNGCFDILHKGHIDYLSKAADLGDILLLGLNTDNSVSRIKGPSRPIQDELSRAMVMASVRFIDAVVLFDEDTPLQLIEIVKPDILVKGNDYKAEDIVGYSTVTDNGGKVVTLDLVEGYSTTKIEDKIKNQ